MRSRVCSVATHTFLLILLLSLHGTDAGANIPWCEDTPFWLGSGYEVMPTAYFPYEMHKLLGVPASNPTPANAPSMVVIDAAQVETDLRSREVGEESILELVKNYGAMRLSMREYAEKKSRWDEEEEAWGEWRRKNNRPSEPPPPPFDLSAYETLMEKLAPEFALYARGASAYHLQAYDQALIFFTQILDLPREQRLHRTVWAIFMRGMTNLRLKHYGEAVSSFEAVRTLVSEGWEDPCRLAPAALGWKGRVHYERGEWVSAVKTYLDACQTDNEQEQQAALMSVRFSFAKIKLDRDAEQLGELVSDDQCRRAMVAWALANPEDSREVRKWMLSKLKSSDAPLPYADRLAWLAYDNGEMELAKRWCELADPTSLITLWVREKTLLHDGKLEEAIDELSAIAHRLEDNVPEDTMDTPSWKTYALLECDTFGFVPLDIRKQIQMELAILRALQKPLHLEECSAAFNALPMDDMLGICTDKMGTDNLQEYVAHWCPIDTPAYQIEFRIRDILIRRLIREKKTQEADTFCPNNPEYPLRQFMEAQKKAEDASLPARVRAENMMATADISRSEGLYGDGFYTEQMWQAASLLPNNDVLTAKALYCGGDLIKYQDPKAADKFYKALVRRNPNLAIAQEADRRRWFPAFWDDTVLYTPYPHHVFTRRRLKALAGVVLLGVVVLCAGAWTFQTRRSGTD
jgi:tetratricopeptide (TPR) repeat protein